MVLRTVSICRLASTAGGMRRILKQKGSVVDYIQKAVETGVYRSEEELQACIEARRDADDLSAVMRRFRQDVVRGSHVHDYPIEYAILRQHPPIPDPPRTPVKLLRKIRQQEMQENKQSYMEGLVRKYVNRYENQGKTNKSNDKSKSTMSADQYYERLLGVQASQSTKRRSTAASAVLSTKSASMQVAYDAAIHHYRLQRTNSNLSDAECMKQVDEILNSQLNDEQIKSKSHRQQAMKLRKDLKQNEKKIDDEDVSQRSSLFEDVTFLKNSPSTVKAMMIWSDRLNAVPYNEWTIGASTALDHWIARQILKISEETWQLCLEGTSPKYLTIGRDIVATREALFPETYLYDSAEESSIGEIREAWDKSKEDDRVEAKNDEQERSIEDLLASLGSRNEQSNSTTSITKRDVDLDADIEKLSSELQEWRQRVHHAKPKQSYEMWPDSVRQEFDSWLKVYVDTVLLGSNEALSKSDSGIDYVATREALLSQPPNLSRDDNDMFWGSLSEPQLASELLHRLNSNAPSTSILPLPPGVLFLSKIWNDLKDDEKLERLLNLGALRPLLDEYASDSSWFQFLQRHGQQLLLGVQLEHLVSDPTGPITTSDLPSDILSAFDIKSNDRFSMVVKGFNDVIGSDSNSEHKNNVIISANEKSYLLYKAWNEHKAGRARYEEKLFQTGRLGLRYNTPLLDEEEEELK